MNVRFLMPARQELDDAVAWYNKQAEGLGLEFLDEADWAIRQALSYPLSCRELELGLRRCLLARFPYDIIYPWMGTLSLLFLLLICIVSRAIGPIVGRGPGNEPRALSCSEPLSARPFGRGAVRRPAKGHP